MKAFFFIILLSLGCFLYSTGQRVTPAQYVAEYKGLAMSEMRRMGVPAAITLAQGILESESGNSELSKKSNNHFGIKCKSNWTKATVTHDDDKNDECFRAYKNAAESYRDHSDFLRGKDRYAFLFKLEPTDYKDWAYGLKKAGYATNPRYPKLLISLIEKYDLQQYTLAAAGDIPNFETPELEDKTFHEMTAISETYPSDAITEYTSITKVTINGCRALFVPKGTSVLSVATNNRINLARLMEINELKKDGILDKGQILFLEKKKAIGNREFYIARAGETMHEIAQKNGILLQSIYEYNQLPNGQIREGLKIYLQPQNDRTNHTPKKPTSFSQKNKHQKQGPILHEVQANEGLYSISKKYDVSISQIIKWNQLDSDKINIGQKLIISK